MEIVPFVSVGAVKFGDTQERVEKFLGGVGLTRERFGLIENWYRSTQVFFREGKVCEIGIPHPGPLFFRGVDIFSDKGAWRELCKIDGKPLEIFGIVVLPALGISFSGLHDEDFENCSVSGFSKGHWDHKFASMSPFTLYR